MIGLMNSRNRDREFLIRVKFFGEGKRTLFELLQTQLDVASLCVVQVNSELHAYVYLREPLTCTKIRRKLLTQTCLEQLVVKKKTSKILKEITFQDRFPFSYNIDYKQFTFNVALNLWAINTEKFSHFDDFVIKHRKYYMFIYNYWKNEKLFAIKKK
jgi:hypothetical protein